MDTDTVADIDIEAVGGRVERLLDEIGTADPFAARAAEQLVSELLALYGAALGRLLERLSSAAPGAAGALADDPLLAGLLSLHGLNPQPVRARVQAALDGLRDLLDGHGAGATVLDVTSDAVRVRLSGGGCQAAQLAQRLEEEVGARVPEVARVEVEPVAPPASDGLIAPDSLMSRPDWVRS